MRAKLIVLFLLLVALQTGCAAKSQWKCAKANTKLYKDVCFLSAVDRVCSVRVRQDNTGLDLSVRIESLRTEYKQSIEVRPSSSEPVKILSTLRGRLFIDDNTDFFSLRCLKQIEELPQSVKDEFQGCYGIK